VGCSTGPSADFLRLLRRQGQHPPSQFAKIDEKLSDAARGWCALDGEATMFDAAVHDEKVRA
jgi:hypothetical protein